jgi:hypothetical protein
MTLHAATLRCACRAYREAAAAYDRAFVRGDVSAIEDAFSRMQEIARAFEQGAEWARRQTGNPLRKVTR